MKDMIIKKLRATLDFALFIKGGEKAFHGTTLKGMIYSYIIPILFLPYGIWGLSMTHNTELQTLSELEGMRNYSFNEYIMISFVKAILVTLISLFILYMFSKFMERTEHFFALVAAGNWMSVIGFFIYLPMTIMVMAGDPEWMSVYMIATITILYSLAISAFSIWRILNIPWEMGTAIAILMLGIGETANKIVHLIGLNYFS